ERFEWWRFEPHQDWIRPAGDPEHFQAPYAAGIPGQVRIIYLYNPSFPWGGYEPRVTMLEPDVRYEAFFWDPIGGQEHPLGAIAADADATWPIPVQPAFQDWVLVLKAR
ncbi:MAG: hypothetical protein M1457_12310, partial [bacterium]|nr:hypothetical protein [bacterium]